MNQTEAVPFQLEQLGLLMERDPLLPEEAEGVLNPAVAWGRDGQLYLFPQVVAERNHSRIGIGRVMFDTAGRPAGVDRMGYALEPKMPYELRPATHARGCEDPRVTYIEPLDLYVMAYTAWGCSGPRVAFAISEDVLTWQRLGVADFQPDPDPVHEAGYYELSSMHAAFFPRAVTAPDGRPSLALIHRPAYKEEHAPPDVDAPRRSLWVSYCPVENVRRDPRELTCLTMHRVLTGPEQSWENVGLGVGTPPVLTPLGWLIIYHGAERRISGDPSMPNDVRLSAGALLMDEDDPLRILYRSDTPILEPETNGESEGTAANVVFPTGIAESADGGWDVYYGLDRQSIGVACMRIPGESSGEPRTPEAGTSSRL